MARIRKFGYISACPKGNTRTVWYYPDKLPVGDYIVWFDRGCAVELQRERELEEQWLRQEAAALEPQRLAALASRQPGYCIALRKNGWPCTLRKMRGFDHCYAHLDPDEKKRHETNRKEQHGPPIPF